MSDTQTAGQSTAAPEGAEQEGQQQEQQAEQQPEAKTFSQEDVNKIVEERLARERGKFADYDDLKAKAAQFDEANATEVERAVAAAVKDAEAALKAQHDADRAAWVAERVADKIEVAATGKFADIEDARLRLAPKAGEFVKEDGSIDVEAIGKAVDEVLDKHPHLKAEAPKATPSASRAGIGVTGNTKPDAQVSPGLGRLAHAYASGESK